MAIYSSLAGPVDQIRLLIIHPGSDGNQEISCDLKIVETDHSPDYEALSYTWGNAKDTLPIRVSCEVMQVTKNLASALKHLRYPDRPRVMWIDAVCINQADMKERSHQVRQMKQIYENAQEVVVWLGEEWHGNQAQKAMATLHALSADEELHWDARLQPTVSRELLDIGHFLALLGLLRQSWWERVWTVQETMLARKITFVCDVHTCSGEQMVALMKSFFKHRNSCCMNYDYDCGGIDVAGELDNVFREVQSLFIFPKDDSSACSLGNLVAQFRNRQATDPRDKIYGLLGIARPIDGMSIYYEQPFARIYEEMTIRMASDRGDLNVLSQIIGEDNHVLTHPHYMPDDSYKVPSWCPDWNLKMKYWTVRELNERLETLAIWNASGDREVEGFLSPGPSETRLFVVDGVVFDMIEEVGDQKWSSRGIDADVFRQWRTMVESDPRFNEDGSSWEDAFWQTLCGGVGGRGTSDGSTIFYPSWAMHKSLFDTWWRDNIASPRERDACTKPSKVWEEKYVIGYGYEVAVASMNRRFMITKSGRMGLAPATAQPGDFVCILFGGRVPYVLRPQPEMQFNQDGELHCGFQFLGDSYVHGFMNGEALEESADSVPMTFFLT